MTTREEVEEMAEVAFQRGESDRLIWIVMEVVLDIRDLLQQIVPLITAGGENNADEGLHRKD